MAKASQTSLTASDEGTTKPSNFRKGVSFTAQVADLELGQCCGKVERVRHDVTISEFARDASDMKAAMRNNLAPSVRSAKSKTGGEYMIEVTVAVTTPGQVYLVAIVTRIG